MHVFNALIITALSNRLFTNIHVSKYEKVNPPSKTTGKFRFDELYLCHNSL
jgi:hypothetical protein